MPLAQITIKEQESGHVIHIETVNGKCYRINVLDVAESIEVTTVNGLLDVSPMTPNTVMIKETLF